MALESSGWFRGPFARGPVFRNVVPTQRRDCSRFPPGEHHRRIASPKELMRDEKAPSVLPHRRGLANCYTGSL